MNTSRISDFTNKSFDGMLTWFSEMSVRGLFSSRRCTRNNSFDYYWRENFHRR